MPSYSYNSDIPNQPNAPSLDQPKMKVNTNSTRSIIGEDHYSFEDSSNRDGWHKQCTFPTSNEPGPITSGTVIEFQKPGVASTEPDLFAKNANGTTSGIIFPMTLMRAMCTYNEGDVTEMPTALATTNQINILSVERNVNNVTITLKDKATNSDDAIIMLNRRGPSNGGFSQVGYSFTSPVITYTVPLNAQNRDMYLIIYQV